MKRIATMFALAALMMTACTDEEAQAQTTNQENMTQKIYLTIGNQTRPATLGSNSATEALVAALSESDITYDANDYGGFEKVGSLGHLLPTSNSNTTTAPGDIILYNGNQIVLFYGSNTWSYTRLGRIEYDSIEQLKSFLKAGQGRVSVTLSLADPSAINTV